MVLKNATTGGTENPLSYTEIAAEFGNPTGNKLGNYRVSEDYGDLDNLPLDTGIPQSGAIRFSDFYGKRANIVIDMYSGSHNNSYNYDVYDDAYSAGKYDVVGSTDRNSISKSQWQGGKKVIIHVNKQFRSSGANSVNHCAVKMGNTNNNNSQSGWRSSTTFAIDIGDSGRIYGRGGNGGRGANSNNNVATAGEEGTSALKLISGVQDEISGASRIIAGGGGGGGGGGAEQDDGGFMWVSGDYNAAGGGGGGGGQGYPAGNGGSGGSPGGANGGAGNANAGGNFGAGGDDAESDAGRGGAGGDAGETGGSGTAGNTGPTKNNNKGGGAGGSKYKYY